MNSPLPPEPPRWANRFLEWFCHPDLLEEIQGDIYELFDLRCQAIGATQARRRFAWDVLRSFRFSTIKNFDWLITSDMLRINTRIALRQMGKQKVFSFIKIGGFALGIAACLLISLYIKDELSFDQHYVDGDQLYRVVAHDSYQGEAHANVFFAAPMARTLLADYPEVVSSARISPGGLFGGGDNPIRRADRDEVTFDDGFMLADNALLELLEVEMLNGQQSDALTEPGSMVISRAKAERYFPGEDPIGQRMLINNNPDQTYTVTGVMENLPKHSHLHQVDFLLSLSEVEFWPGEQGYWRANNYHTYVKLRPDVDQAALETKLLSIIDNYYIPSMEAEGITDAREQSKNLRFSLQPVEDIYLKSGDIIDLLPHGDIRFVRLLGLVVMMILLLAAINFVNLSTAKSANRAREVGLRKVVGSRRRELIGQFLVESTVISTLAVVMGVALARLVLPFFNGLADKSLAFPWLSWWFLPILLGLALVLGVAAGAYPAAFLSTFKPIDVLRGSISRGAKSSWFRNGLVVFQFTTSIILLIGTIVIYQQMSYMQNKQLGFQKDQVLLLQATNTLEGQVNTFKEELSRLPGIDRVSISDYLPVEGTARNSNRFISEGDERLIAQYWLVDYDYVDVLGMDFVAGRNFSPDRLTDSSSLVINEAFAKELGYADPVGKRIERNGERTIIGVVKDFHWRSLRDKIFPVALSLGSSPGMMSVKFEAGKLDALLPQLQALWDRFSPNQALNYTFLDQQYAQMYTDVQRTRNVFLCFALLAVFIACLGLFALSTFLAEQRYKEISTRKVLGASNWHIIRQLSQNFLLLVGLSLLLAVPVGWYVMDTWLTDFAYRIDLNWSMFALAGGVALLVAILTISYQTVKAARIDPVLYLQR
ncbi:MAG: ABC transporter permease [Bacteroidota bacterium]